MAFLGQPVTTQFEVLKALGVAHAGVTSASLRESGAATVRECAAQAEVTVDYIVHGIFSSIDDDVSWTKESIDLRAAIDDASALGSTLVYCTSGRAGRLLFDEAFDRLIQRLTGIVRYASDQGVTVALENSLALRTDCSFLFSVADALHAAERLDASICADLYPAYLEPGLETTLRRAEESGRLALVQVSTRAVDSLTQPDRRVPGDCDLPLDALLAIVARTGYQGLIDLELLGPAIEREGARPALQRGLEWLAPRLGNYQARPRLSPRPTRVRRVMTAPTHIGDTIGEDQWLHTFAAPTLPDGVELCVVWVAETAVPEPSQPARDHEPGWMPGEVSPGSVRTNVLVLRPGATIRTMHRTDTIDIIEVTKGSITLRMEDSTSSVLYPGDWVVQRATTHTWENHCAQTVQMSVTMIGIAPRDRDRTDVIGETVGPSGSVSSAQDG